MPNMHVTERSPARTRNMNIRRARQLSESWELTFETLLSVLGNIRDTNLYLGEEVTEIQEDLKEIVSDLPNQREWSQPYLFKLCTMVTGSCTAKKNIKIAANGWKTACEALYIIYNLSKNMEVGDNESIDEFESIVQDMFTEEWLWEAQGDAFGFEFCIDGFWSQEDGTIIENENYESAATIQVENDSETTDEDENETDTEDDTEDETEDEDEDYEEESDYESGSENDSMPELEDCDDYIDGNYIDLSNIESITC